MRLFQSSYFRSPALEVVTIDFNFPSRFLTPSPFFSMIGVSRTLFRALPHLSNLSTTGDAVEVGEAVGTIAAQSIG